MIAKILLASWVVASAALIPTSTLAADGDLVNTFVAACQKDKNLDDAKRKQVLALIERDRSEDAHSVSTITGALRVMYPEFQKALVALGDEQFDSAAEKFTELAKSENRFLADDATYFHARTLMNSEQYEEALPLLAKITTASKDALTLHKGEALFMRGVCETGLLNRKNAITSFKRFLKENPHAAERLRVGAEYQIAELDLITDGSLLDVQARMEASRRLLGLEKSGEETQQQQEKIISLISALIEEAEQKEKKGSGECKDCGKPKGSKPGQCPGGGECPGGSKPGAGGGGTGKAGSPGAEGGKSNGADATELGRRTFNGSRSAWAKKRKQDYEKVLDALKAKYPNGRYSKLAEEYRRTLQEDEK